jgi:hypothetical protein
VHHVDSRGAGGDDVDVNLITLCIGPGTNDCHGKAHRGLINREDLRSIAERKRRVRGAAGHA